MESKSVEKLKKVRDRYMSRATGKVFDKLYQLRQEEIKDSDGNVRSNLNPSVPSVAAEGSSTAVSTYGWEVLQRDVPVWPGSTFDLNDMAADTGGHVLGSLVLYELTWRRKHQPQ